MKSKSLILIQLFFALGLPHFSLARDLSKESVSQLNLQDLSGKKLSLSEASRESTLIAVVSASVDCPMMQKSFIKYEKASAKWKDKKILFLYVDSSPKFDMDKIKKEISRYHVTLPLYLDPKQELAQTFGFVSTNQVMLFDLKASKIIYEGALDSSINYWSRNSKPEPYLDTAINEYLAGKPISKPKTESFGCAITFSQKL